MIHPPALTNVMYATYNRGMRMASIATGAPLQR